MWFLLLIGALVVAAVSRSPREATFPSRPPQLPPPPGPIAVLGEFVRIGQTPPPTVILCAIAEAETIGRNDLASDIIRIFVAPVVYQHELAKAKRVPAAYGRQPLSHAHATYPSAPYGRQSLIHPPVPYERGSCALPSLAQRSPREDVFHTPATDQAPHGTTRLATDEEIRAMLNADPQKFIEMATRGAPVIEVPVEAVHRAAQVPQPPPPPAQPTGLPAETVAQMQEAAGLPEAADRTRALAPGSPIAGISDFAWREFVMRLERESPQFSSSRHVGQYRQRRERLAELGVNPNALDSSQAQRAALDVDLADAHRHAAEGGLLTEHLGRPITVPGHEGSETITLSGVLGVIQCAGLEGAVGWLEQPSDRKKFPHTTMAFLRTNGVF